jgi:hypothetical protein
MTVKLPVLRLEWWLKRCNKNGNRPSFGTSTAASNNLKVENYSVIVYNSRVARTKDLLNRKFLVGPR